MASRESKRQRLSGSPAGQLQEENSHEAFTSWAQDRGVQIHGIKATRIPGRGVGLLTTKKVREGDLILHIPQRAMFKPDIAMLKRENLTSSSPQAHLAITALLAFGPADSAYSIWRHELPTLQDFRASMPIYWPQSLQDLLPPSARQSLTRQSADYQKDWDAVSPICQTHGFREEDFKYYWMIVNSRSFHWKPPRGKAGLMVMCPFIDYMNHGPSGSGCSVEQSGEGYKVRADRDYESADPGEELLATYGAHSNDKLLVHYGFICSSDPTPSPDDEVQLDGMLLPKLGPAVCQQLQDVGYLGAYSLIPSTNEVCFRTQVAVRAALQTANEWEYFMGCGEDLSGDFGGEVRKFLVEAMREYKRVVSEHCAMVEGLGDDTEVAKTILAGRWQQIDDALDKYCEA